MIFNWRKPSSWYKSTLSSVNYCTLQHYATVRERSLLTSLRCDISRKGETPARGRMIFKGDPFARICVIDRYLLKWNQVPGAPSRSFVFFPPQQSLCVCVCVCVCVSLSISLPLFLSSSLTRHCFFFLRDRPACRSAFAIRTRYFVAPRFRMHSCPPIRRTCVILGLPDLRHRFASLARVCKRI